MNVFLATNGYSIIETDTMVQAISPGQHKYIGDGVIGEAVKEYIDHVRANALKERDEELGRWRWPENPDYVVYPNIEPGHEMAFGSDLSVMIFHEPTGVLKGYCRAEDQGGDLTREYPGAARAYFDAHPEPKPWHDAKPGEVWAVATRNVGDERALQVTPRHTFQYNDGAEVDLTYEAIETARRIWPEAKS